MKIYLASRYSRREELCGYKSDLEKMGHSVTSRWLLGTHQWPGERERIANEYEEGGMPEEAVRFAQEDIEDLSEADVLIIFPDKPRVASTSRGGMHVEFGWALAKCKPIIVCGQRQNVFHLLPGIKYAATWAVTKQLLEKQ